MLRYIFILIVFAGLFYSNQSKESKTPQYEALASIQANQSKVCFCWEYFLKSDPINNRELYQTCDSLQWLRIREQVEVFEITIPCPNE